MTCACGNPLGRRNTSGKCVGCYQTDLVEYGKKERRERIEIRIREDGCAVCDKVVRFQVVRGKWTRKKFPCVCGGEHPIHRKCLPLGKYQFNAMTCVFAECPIARRKK